MTDDSELLHGALEVVHHQLLVVDHTLPFAGRALAKLHSCISLHVIKVTDEKLTGSQSSQTRWTFSLIG